MYDRLTLYSSAENIREQFAVEVPEGYRPSYNSAPTQLMPIIITNENKRGISFFHWGLMTKWSNNKASISAKSINLASDVAFQRASYKRQIQSRSCIVPINGFYVWKRVAKKRLVPYYFFPTEMELLGVAGVWEMFEDVDGVVSHSFTIITVPSSTSVADFDSQMPAILEPINCLKWLDYESIDEREQLISTIADTHPKLTSHSVTPQIRNVNNNFPELVNSIPASDQLGNYTLFS